MKHFKFYKKISYICVILCALSFAYLMYTKSTDAKQTQVSLIRRSIPRHYTVQQLSLLNRRKHLSRDAQYRIYSHHYLTIEHHDLMFLRDLGNHMAKLTNHVAHDDYSTSRIYQKYHDGNYWSIFHDTRVPSNFRKSHMNNSTYNLVNKRVLKSHGVYSGINFNNHIASYSIDSH